MKTNKTYYAPALEVVDFVVENGFAASGENVNANTISDWEDGNDDWFQSN